MTLTEAEQRSDKAGLALVAAYGVGVFAGAGDGDLDPARAAATGQLERL